MSPILDAISAALGTIDAMLGILEKLSGDRNPGWDDMEDDSISTRERIREFEEERNRLAVEVGQGLKLRNLRSEIKALVEQIERTELPQIQQLVDQAEGIWKSDRQRARLLLGEAQRRNDRARRVLGLLRDVDSLVGDWVARKDINGGLMELRRRLENLR